MNRFVIAVAASAALAACGSNSKTGNGSAAPAAANQSAAAPAGNAAGNSAVAPKASAPPAATQTDVPANYDWTFTTHGGSGTLDFGDGDPAEGVQLVTFSCLPGANRAEISWGEQRPATLRSGSQSAEFQPGATLAVDHPLATALRSSGTAVLVLGGVERRLGGRPTGRAAADEFFTYCSAAAGRDKG